MTLSYWCSVPECRRRTPGSARTREAGQGHAESCTAPETVNQSLSLNLYSHKHLCFSFFNEKFLIVHTVIGPAGSTLIPQSRNRVKISFGWKTAQCLIPYHPRSSIWNPKNNHSSQERIRTIFNKNTVNLHKHPQNTLKHAPKHPNKHPKTRPNLRKPGTPERYDHGNQHVRRLALSALKPHKNSQVCPKREYKILLTKTTKFAHKQSIK